jgi:hypothetical protein
VIHRSDDLRSLADAKLTKNGIENLFHIGYANYFPDRA